MDTKAPTAGTDGTGTPPATDAEADGATAPDQEGQEPSGGAPADDTLSDQPEPDKAPPAGAPPAGETVTTAETVPQTDAVPADKPQVDSAAAAPPAAAAPAQVSDSFSWVPPPQAAADSEDARVIASAWQDQALWSAVGTAMGDSIFKWRIVAAVAGIAGLALSVAVGSGWFGSGHAATVWATVGVLLLAAVPYFRQQLVSDQRVLQWTKAREASEDLKQAIYRHLMGVLQPVADGGGTADQGTANLVRRCRAIKQTVADLAGEAAATVPPEKKDPTLSLTIDGYVAKRVEGQMRYYRGKGEYNGRITQWLRRSELVLGLVTVLMGAWASGLGSAPDAATLKQVMPAAGSAAVDVAASAVTAATSLVQQPGAQAASSAGAPGSQQQPEPAPRSSGWLAMLALVAAATGAITTYLAASRHAELAAKYYATYDRLKDHHAEWRVAPDRDAPERMARFVDAIERAIADEYSGWVTDWKATRQTQK